MLILAWRRLARQPLASASAILTLGLALAACTAVFAVLQTVLLSPLPVREADQVVHLLREQSPVTAGPISPPAFADLEVISGPELQVAGWMQQTQVLQGTGVAERLDVAAVSGGYFEVMRLPLLAGRTLDPQDQLADAEPVAVISSALARRQFGDASAALGRSLRLDGRELSVVGVLAPEVSELLGSELWLPARFQLREQNRGYNYISVLARLGEGLTPAQLDARLADLTARWIRDFPENHAGLRLYQRGLLEHQTRHVAGMLWLLQGAVVLLLAVACANIANLALARLASRQRELATEVALGASRWRLLRGAVAESALLAGAGLLLGMLLAHGLLELLRGWAPAGLPRVANLTIGGGAWLVALSTTLLAVLLAGLLPGWAASRMAAAGQRQGQRQDGAGSLRANWRRGLVAGQLGLSTVLLVGCLLVLQQLAQLAAVNPGFRSEGLLSARIVLPNNARSDDYAQMLEDSRQNRQFLDGVLAELAALPGVQSAAAVDLPPLSGSSTASGEIGVVGRPDEPGQRPTVEWRWITPGYFETAGVPLLRGRPASAKPDNTETVINARLAATLFGNEDPIGQRLEWWGQELTIVGIAGDALQWSLGREASTEMYLQLGQVPAPDITTLLLRTQGDPLALAEPLRRTVARIAPGTPVFELRSMDEQVARSLGPVSFVLRLLGLFALLAVAVSAVGLYGLMSFSVTRRALEMGVRLALGAQPARLRRLVLGEAAALAVAGIAIGLLGAWSLARWLASLQFSPTGQVLPIYLAGALLLAAVALLAAWLPARRAAATAPMRALRAE